MQAGLCASSFRHWRNLRRVTTIGMSFVCENFRDFRNWGSFFWSRLRFDKLTK